MKKLMSIFGAALFVFSLTLSSCSEDEKAKEEVRKKADEEKENTGMKEDINLNDLNKLIDIYQETLNIVNDMEIDNKDENVDIDDVNKVIDIYQEVLKIADDMQKHDD